MDMLTYKDILIQNNKNKEKLSKELGISTQQVQQYMLEILSIAKENNQAINASLIIKASKKENSVFSVLNEIENEEEKIEVIEKLLHNLSIIINEDGKAYSISLV